MKKVLKVMLKILLTIIALPFAIIGGVLLGLMCVLGFIFVIPAAVFCDIWDIDLDDMD